MSVSSRSNISCTCASRPTYHPFRPFAQSSIVTTHLSLIYTAKFGLVRSPNRDESNVHTRINPGRAEPTTPSKCCQTWDIRNQRLILRFFFSPIVISLPKLRDSRNVSGGSRSTLSTTRATWCKPISSTRWFTTCTRVSDPVPRRVSRSFYGGSHHLAGSANVISPAFPVGT